jgi:hypothetical protein
MRKFSSVVALAILGTWAGVVNAQYVIVLKNGRQLTVQSYREEGSTVKIQGLGGELGIPKEQIQSISKAGQNDRPGLNLNSLENASRSAPVAAKPSAGTPAKRPNDVSADSIDTNSSVNAEEEKEYRRKLAEVTQKLESARKRYLEASSAGNTGAKFEKEGIRSWTADLAARIQDSQKAGGGPASTPLAWTFPAPYTPKAKELSDMRMDVEKLEKERNDLIQEMKSKNIEP